MRYKTGNPRPLPSCERLHELLRPDANGTLRWRVDRGGVRAGSIAGTIRPDGYCQIMIDSHRYLAHRISWKMHHGSEPSEYVNHEDGDLSNNRPDNLREATKWQNNVNPKGGAYEAFL